MGFVLARAEDAQRILDYLYEDIGNCLYIYIDIKEYGIGGDVIDVWLQEADGAIVAVLMRYSDGFQIYARSFDADCVDVKCALDLMSNHGGMRLMGPRTLIERCELLMEQEAKTFYGSVFEIKHHHLLHDDAMQVEEATVDDVPEIVDLACALLPDMSVGHERDATIRVFRNRLENGTGKNWIIRVDGKIAAHLAISASCDDIAVLSQKFVAMEFRTYPYAAVLDSYVINTAMPAMGKRGFSLVMDKRIIRQFQLMKNPIVGEYGYINLLDATDGQ